MHQERDLLICATEDTMGPLGEIHPMLQHVTRSRDGISLEQVNSTVGNKIELKQMFAHAYHNILPGETDTGVSISKSAG
jgi:hypothetical protein